MVHKHASKLNGYTLNIIMYKHDMTTPIPHIGREKMNVAMETYDICFPFASL